MPGGLWPFPHCLGLTACCQRAGSPSPDCDSSLSSRPCKPPFDLESYSEGCHDALRVLPDGEQLCGQVPPSDIAVAANEALRVEFSSDDSVVRAGFRLSCMPLTTEAQGEVVVRRMGGCRTH